MKTSLLRGAATTCGALCLTLSGCGGNGPPTQGTSQFDYTPSASARHSYAPYAAGAAVFTLVREDGAEVSIGGDVEPRQAVRYVGAANGFKYYLGPSRDGVGVDRLQDFEADLLTDSGSFRPGQPRPGFVPFTVAPLVFIDGNIEDDIDDPNFLALFQSILILNDALPPEFQMLSAGQHPTGTPGFGEIVVKVGSRASVAAACPAGAVACAFPQFNRATVHLPDDFDLSEYTYPRSVILHELLHALGVRGHVDSVEFPDSILGRAGEHFPNPGYILSGIDREILQIMYMSQKSDIYNDWGEWSDIAFHVMGESDDGDLRFGAALFNGLPQPWVRGALPDTNLRDNRRLFGTATWTGSLLGFSGVSPISGDAELQIRLSALADPASEHDLRFRDIAWVNRWENQDRSASSDRWFPTRNVDYRVMVSGNEFWNVLEEGYEQGVVSGAFLGTGHEHMGGTVKRTDMVAAFGGSR